MAAYHGYQDPKPGGHRHVTSFTPHWYFCLVTLNRMSFVPLVIDIISIFFLTLLLHYYFGNWRKHHVIVTVATFMSWFLPFMIIFVLPIDVVSTCYQQCEIDNNATGTTRLFPYTVSSGTTLSYSSVTTTSPSYNGSDTDVLNPITDEHGDSTRDSATGSLVTSGDKEYSCKKPKSYVNPEVLNILWHVVYWTSQSLTWVILPIMQSYTKAGEFSIFGKLKYALIVNAIYYGTYLLIFGICLIYLATLPDAHIDAAQLKVLAITASNTWGLFLLVLLLGYGLVEIPRLLWNYSKRQYTLDRLRFKIAKMSIERIEAEEELEDVLAETKRIHDVLAVTHPYRRFVNTIVRKCPESFRSTLTVPNQTAQRNNRDGFMGVVEGTDVERDLSQKSLAKLHRRVIVAVQRHNSTQCQWNKLLENAIYLDDVCRNQNSGIRVYTSSVALTGVGLLDKCSCPRLEWYWKCWIVPWSCRILVVLMAALSIMVVWSECLFFIQEPVLSLFAIFLDIARKYYNFVGIEMLCACTISYISICAYYTVFKMRIFNYYVVVGNHHTDENSLIFCGMMLCRLTPPLCLNFLGLLHLDSHITSQNNIAETSYTKFMGHMDVIKFISNGFNIYFPIAIVLLCILTGFSVGQRVLHCLGFQQFIGDDEMTQELVEEGANLIGRELRKRQRNEESETRRRTYQDRYDNNRPTRGGGESTLPDLEETSRKRTIGRAINDNDRSELLQEAAPMDYSVSPMTEGQNRTGATRPQDFTSGLYQAGGAGPRPLQQSGVEWSVSSGSSRNNRYNPPRGIFDDV